MKNKDNFRVVMVVLSILFFPIALLVWCIKGLVKIGNNKKNNDEITMDEVIDIEELFED